MTCVFALKGPSRLTGLNHPISNDRIMRYVTPLIVVLVLWTGNPHFHVNYPFTARVVAAPQMISQPVSSIFLCSPLPSWTWSVHSLMLFAHFFLCLLCLLHPPPPTHTHTPFIVPCKSVLARSDERETCSQQFSLRLFLRWSGGLRLVRLPAGSRLLPARTKYFFIIQCHLCEWSNLHQFWDVAFLPIWV